MNATLAAAWAQSVPSASYPQGLTPGAVNSSLQKQFDQEQPKVEEKQAAPQVQVSPEESQTDQVSLPTFKLEEIQIRNSTILTREDLAPIITPLIGQEVDERQLLQASHAITELYHQKGYLTSQAFLPSQKIVDGVVVIYAQERRVGNITVQGTKHVEPDWILKQISAKKGDVFNVVTLERELNQIQKNPRIVKIRADIRPGELPDTNDTNLVVEDARPLHMVNTFDNSGREGVGILHYNTTLVDNDVFGLGHQLIASYTGASGLHSGILQYSAPLNDWGWTVGARASVGKTRIGGAFEPADITGLSDVFSLYTSVPLVKKEKLSLTADLSGNAKFSNLFVQNTRLDTQDQNIETVEGGWNFLSYDKLGHWSIDNHWGVSLGDEAHFFKTTGSVNRTLSLPKGMVLVLKTEGQWSAQNLPGLEQYQIGGYNSVRGYSEGFLIGDTGYVLGSELHLPFWGLPDSIKQNAEWLLFAETGTVKVSEINDPGTSGTPGTLFSYGVGLRGRVSRYLSGRLDVGFAQKFQDQQPVAQVHFGLSAYPF